MKTILTLSAVAALVFLCVPAQARAAIVKPPNNIGLIGYWPVNENSGTVAYDSSSGKNNGRLVSSPSWGAGKYGPALTFGASSNYVSTGLSWPSSGGSMSLWVYPTSYSDWISPAGWKVGSPTNYILLDEGGNGTPGKWRAVFKANSTPSELDVVATSNIVQNTWQHLVVTWSVSGGVYTVHLYVNGVDQGSGTWTGSAISAGGFHFGNSGDYGDNYFKGKVDDVRVYNYALSPAQVAALYAPGSTKYNTTAALNNGSTLTQGLVGWWTFDGSTIGTTIQDSSGRGNNGYVGSGGPATSTMKAQGKLGQALNFNGSTSYVNVPSFTALNSTSAMTICAWVYLNTLGTTNDTDDSGIVTKATSGSAEGILLWYNVNTSGTDGLHVYTFSVGSETDPSNRVNGATAAKAKVWQHVCGEMSGSNRLLYLNGALDATATGASLTSYTGGAAAAWIGGWSNTTNLNFDGKIDDVRIYNRALSAAEVKQLYQQGGDKQQASGATLQNGTTLAAGLAGYWSFNGPDTTDKIYDRSGNANNGYLNSGVSTSSMKVQGKAGQAFNWNGSSKYVVIPSSGSINSSDITVAGWFKFGAQNAYQTMVAKWYTGVQQQFVLQYNSDNLIGWWTGDGSTGASVLESSGPPQVGYWYFIVATISGTSKKLYINGVLDNSNTGTAIGTNNVELTIGSKKNSGGSYFEPFTGSMDEIRVYNRALSASEVWQLYLMSGGPVFIPPPPVNPGA